MSTRHTQIALTDAQPGMTLSDPVLDTKGNVLLPAGMTLTATLLASLQRHQIGTLAIAAEALSDAEEERETDRQIARVEWLFRMAGTPGRTADGADPTAGATATAQLHQYVLHFRSGMTS